MAGRHCSLLWRRYKPGRRQGKPIRPCDVARANEQGVSCVEDKILLLRRISARSLVLVFLLLTAAIISMDQQDFPYYLLCSTNRENRNGSTALQECPGKSVVVPPPYRGKPPYLFQVLSAVRVAASDFDGLVSGYRLTQTALLGDPYCIFCTYVPMYRVPCSAVNSRFNPFGTCAHSDQKIDELLVQNIVY